MHLHSAESSEPRCTTLSGSFQCERITHTSGPHIVVLYKGTINEYPILYDYNDTSKHVHDLCRICLVKLDNKNKSQRPGCSQYCVDHDQKAYDSYFAHNGCKKCGFDGPHNLRNYNELWGDGDIHCGQCGEYVRMFDRG